MAPFAERLPLNTLASLLQDEIIPIEELLERHGKAATIAKTLLGVVPNTGKFLEIWPPANKMYYFMVPSFLNLPMMMFGFGAPKDLVGLALYASSLYAGCPYCTSHTCTFSVRRGLDAEKLHVHAIENRDGESADLYTLAEKSVIDVAQALAIFPCRLTNEERLALQMQMKNASDTEAVVLGMAMMGYLNKSMDALGMPLEVETYRETREIMGDMWSPGKASALLDPEFHTADEVPHKDSFLTYWSMIIKGPSAANFERKALSGIPDDAVEAGTFLFHAYGYDFPVLKRMQHARAIRAITAMIHESFNPETSLIGIKMKVAVGTIFAAITQSKPIEVAIDAIAKRFKIDQAWLHIVKAFAKETEPVSAAENTFTSEEKPVQALLALAHAAAWTPTRIDETVVLFCRDAHVASAGLVEVVAVVSMLQMLHRVSMFYISDNSC